MGYWELHYGNSLWHKPSTTDCVVIKASFSAFFSKENVCFVSLMNTIITTIYVQGSLISSLFLLAKANCSVLTALELSQQLITHCGQTDS